MNVDTLKCPKCGLLFHASCSGSNGKLKLAPNQFPGHCESEIAGNAMAPTSVCEEIWAVYEVWFRQRMRL